MHRKLEEGLVWNESQALTDRATGRQVRQLTQSGTINNTPTFHLGTAFDSESRYLVLTSERTDGSALIKADLITGDLTVLGWEPKDSGFAFLSGRSALVPEAGVVAATYGNRLRLYDSEHGGCVKEWSSGTSGEHNLAHAMGTADGRTIYVPRIPADPERMGAEPAHAWLVEQFGGMPTTLLAVEVATGDLREVYHDPIMGTHHAQPNPVDGDLVLMDRGAPPSFAHGSDGGKTTRVWTLRVSTGELTEIRPRDANRFQIHPVWSADGRHIYYHGRCREGGYPFGKTGGWHYIGVATREGEVFWEGKYPWFHYGHVSSDPRRNRILIDSLITPDLVCALDYSQARGGMPPVEVLARHGSQVNALPGQASHPHCHLSPNGRWLSYNAADAKRADVYVVDMGEGD
jgi:hypothetical protein